MRRSFCAINGQILFCRCCVYHVKPSKCRVYNIIVIYMKTTFTNLAVYLALPLSAYSLEQYTKNIYHEQPKNRRGRRTTLTIKREGESLMRDVFFFLCFLLFLSQPVSYLIFYCSILRIMVKDIFIVIEKLIGIESFALSNKIKQFHFHFKIQNLFCMVTAYLFL